MKAIIKEHIEDLNYANDAMESARKFAELIKNELKNEGKIIIVFHYHDRCVCVLLLKNLGKKLLEKAKEINEQKGLLFKFSDEAFNYYTFYLYF